MSDERPEKPDGTERAVGLLMTGSPCLTGFATASTAFAAAHLDWPFIDEVVLAVTLVGGLLAVAASAAGGMLT